MNFPLQTMAVPTWLGTQIPEPPLWEWEHKLPSSNHVGPYYYSFNDRFAGFQCICSIDNL